MAIDAIKAAPDAAFRDLDRLVQDVQDTVRREALKRSKRMGTTLTLARIDGGSLLISHVGDSIAFVHDSSESRRVTRDQTLAEQLRETGEARVPDYTEHILTQCLGQGGRIHPVAYKIDWLDGARLLICSDGVTAVLDDDAVLEMTAEAESPESLVKALIDEANRLGGPDNITAVAVFND